VQDDSDSYTSPPYIYFIRRPLSLLFLSFFFFLCLCRAFKWPLHKIA
jgi:hypothetical protein